MKKTTVVTGLLVALFAVPADAQMGRVRVNTTWESYSFDAGLIFSSIDQLTIPVGIDFNLGRMGSITLSTGYTRVSLTSSNVGQFPHQNLSGALDTEVRLGFNVIPGKLVAFVNGAVPTGVKTVERNELAILGALSSDIIGFAAPTVGSGGAVGGGLAGALSLGRMAIGIGGTYKLPLSYVPVVGQADKLKPGSEFRMRLGLEGPIARTTYLRLAGVYAGRAKDQVGPQTQNGVGNRIIGYLALSQGLGNSQLSLYAFDVYRGSPQFEATAQGGAVLQKGNLLAFGARFGLALGTRTTVTPRVELRFSRAAPTDPANPTSSLPLEKLGNSMRFGLDFRQQLSNRFALVLTGGGISGNVVQGGSDVGLSGYRLGMHLQLSP